VCAAQANSAAWSDALPAVVSPLELDEEPSVVAPDDAAAQESVSPSAMSRRRMTTLTRRS
jgi:hypothetical protein